MTNEDKIDVICAVPTEDVVGNAKFISLLIDTRREDALQVLSESDKIGPLRKTLYSAAVSKRSELYLMLVLASALNQLEEKEKGTEK